MSKPKPMTTKELATDIKRDVEMCLHMVDLLRVPARASGMTTVQFNAESLIFATDYLIECLVTIELSASELLLRKD